MKKYKITNNKRTVSPEEVAQLFIECGWGTKQSIKNTHELFTGNSFVVFARDSKKKLIGILRVNDDGLYSNVIDIVIHPSHTDRTLSNQLIEQVKGFYKDTEIYIGGLNNSQKFFFVNRGFKLRSKVEVPVVSKFFNLKF
jgi:N-acetylglutamate synthase-like GNAT family acetyltransferase